MSGETPVERDHSFVNLLDPEGEQVSLVLLGLLPGLRVTRGWSRSTGISPIKIKSPLEVLRGGILAVFEKSSKSYQKVLSEMSPGRKRRPGEDFSITF